MNIPYELVYIKWKDATNIGDGEWGSMEDFKALSLMEIHSVGFVVDETEEYITLVSHIYDNDVGGYADLCIPKTGILDLTVLGESKDDG